MISLQAPTLGPIIGFSYAGGARIWSRGDAPRARGSDYAFCVVQHRPVGGAWSAPLINKLEPHFDYTGVVALGGLAPNQRYDYRVAWFASDLDLPAVQQLSLGSLAWPAHIPQHTFRSANTAPGAEVTVAAGSCRYLLRLPGGDLFDARGDKTFASIESRHGPQLSLDALLMIGDQIYADDMLGIAPDRRLGQFFARYRDAFGQPALRRLMSKLPTYMILDDHEIENDWPAKASSDDRRDLYPKALQAYQVYQASHSPLFGARADGRIDGAFTQLWYTFSIGCADFFVTDARTERDLSRPRLMSDGQLDALCAWLGTAPERVKVVVTSVPVFPDLYSEADDKWQGFPVDRNRLLMEIRALGRRNVILLSGDLHVSYVASLELQPGQCVHQVVSSAFYWPWPGMRGDALKFGRALSGSTLAGECRALSSLRHEDNFATLTLRPAGADVAFYERKGDLLERVPITF